jgi:ABC-2 type transport system permease protein
VNDLRLYLRYLGVSLRGQMQYRASFIMMAIGLFVSLMAEFAAVWALFARFGTLRGWTLAEIMLFYGTINVAFGLAEGAFRGFDTFDDMVRGGHFDRILLRPRSPAVQIASQELQLVRLGRLAQGATILVAGSVSLHLAWTLPKVLLFLWAIVGGACLFGGLFILQATMCFWTTESLEIMNTVTYGGTETAQYPVTIYRDWFRQFFTYVIPLAAVTYYPILAILGKDDPLGSTVPFQALAPIIGVAFMVVALQAWRVGVRHYVSTGS